MASPFTPEWLPNLMTPPYCQSILCRHYSWLALIYMLHMYQFCMMSVLRHLAIVLLITLYTVSQETQGVHIIDVQSHWYKFKHNTACPWGCCHLGLASKASEQLDGAVPMVCTVVNIILFNGILTILVTFSLWMDTCAYLSVDLPWGHNMYCSCRSHSELTYIQCKLQNTIVM